MQQVIKFLYFSIATCLLSVISIAQNENAENKYRAVHWGLDEGLSQGETYHMIKDINGFLWIGTRYGLNRFDGNSFKVYTHERNNNKSLIANEVIEGLVEDSLHNIWIGSEDRGVSRYNIKSENFTNFFPDSIKKNDGGTITPFWATKKEVLCIERKSLITAYNIYTSQKKVLATLKGYGTINSVFDSSTNTVWCLAPNPRGNAMLLQVSISNNKINLFPLPHYSKSTYLDAEAMCYDAARKCIWINGNEGLLQFTLSDKQFHHLNALKKYEQLKNYGRFVGITLDKQNRVWFATHPKGIIIYNPHDESVSFPFPADSAKQFDVSDANACIYCDRDDIIWSGFWWRKGIYEIVPFSPVVKKYTSSLKKDSLNGTVVLGAVDAGNGKVWIGTANGINILDTKTNAFHVLLKKDLPGIKTDGFMIAIAIDTLTEKAWLATSAGILKMDMLTKKSKIIIFKTLNTEITINTGIPKFDGKEFFFNSYDDSSQHVYVLNFNSDTAHEILSFKGLLFNVFYTVPVKNHLLFLQGGNDENGNQTYENKNGKWLRIHSPIDGIRWTSIAYIKENNTYWVAGESQLFHFDKNFKLIKSYNQDNGMPELPVVGLIRDNNGDIWFHTDRSIQELNIATGQIITMSEADGFEKQNFELFPRANKDANGNIYYGGGVFGDGLDEITPGNFISTTSSVYFKSLTINQKSFPLKENINYTDTLSLKYNQTKIEIETGIIDFYSRGRSRIRYKLEGSGLHESWQYAPYYYTIRYDGLQPGNYKLILQASNASNEFNGPEKTLYMHITPAFWNTWWFRIIAVICAVAFIYGLIRWRLQQRFRLRLERLEKENQMSELKQKAIELEMQALRAQMNPHFIFNSLNSINRFILQNERAQASEYLTKFSKLVRLILQNSQSSLIPLESELESLGLYLNLEALRFNYHFDYKISVPKDLDISALQVPPLILQPYVENAIWHGLMHKEEKGQLNVEVIEEDEHLYFKITDNGIGREKASALASKSATKHKSMGLRITASRIAIMQNTETLQSPVTINDLVNADGTATGTEVVIKMPVIYD